MIRLGVAVLLMAAMLPAAIAQPDPAATETVREPERALVQVAIETPERRALRERAEALQAEGQAAPREVVLADGVATLTLRDGEAFIAQPDADWLRSEVWKQETRGVVAGVLLSPEGRVTDPLGGHVSISYVDSGEFASVDDIDADWTLFDLQARADERLGADDVSPVTATWAVPPVIDRERQVFRFLVRFSREDGGVRHSGTIFKSGRSGMLAVTGAVADTDLARFQDLAASLEQRLVFNPGFRAEDFNPETDRRAEVTRTDPDSEEPVDAWLMIGTAALVVGGSALVLMRNGGKQKAG